MGKVPQQIELIAGVLKVAVAVAHQSGPSAPDVPVSWAMSVPRSAKSVGGLCGAEHNAIAVTLEKGEPSSRVMLSLIAAETTKHHSSSCAGAPGWGGICGLAGTQHGLRSARIACLTASPRRRRLARSASVRRLAGTQHSPRLTRAAWAFALPARLRWVSVLAAFPMQRVRIFAALHTCLLRRCRALLRTHLQHRSSCIPKALRKARRGMP